MCIIGQLKKSDITSIWSLERNCSTANYLLVELDFLIVSLPFLLNNCSSEQIRVPNCSTVLTRNKEVDNYLKCFK